MAQPTSVSSLTILISTYLRFAAAAPSLTDDSHCGCYLTNGTTPSYFTKHKFYDFRSLDQYQGVPNVLTDQAATRDAPPTSNYFTSTDWSSLWQIQTWDTSGRGARSDATVSRFNSANNVYIEKNTDPAPSSSTYLTLRTERLPDFQTAAELESKDNGTQFLSIRMLSRTIGSAGAVTAMFTYRAEPGEEVQEADLEVLTRYPRNTVTYTNQPSVGDDGNIIAAATQNATLPGGLDWSTWAVHRLDWTPTQSTWFVNGVRTANISFQVPRDPAQVILNSWSDGGQWTGNMSVHDAAFFQIQWLEMVWNSTAVAGRKGRRAEAGCKAVCSVDETSKTGTPVMLWNNGAGGRAGTGGREGVVGWIPLLLVLGMAYASSGSGFGAFG